MRSEMPLLFVDEDVVVANKPSGLAVHRGWDRAEDVAMFRVRDQLGQHVYPVHRLDRATSGALLFARSPEAAAAIGRAFESRRVEKFYLALVRGAPKEESGTIDHAIPGTEDGPRVPAVTRYRLISRSPVDRCALVLAVPETGRMHQIRRHLKHIGNPLIGDVKYGSGPLNRHYRSEYALHRLALHASRITFDHPRTGARITVNAPVPDDLGNALDRLGLPCEA